MTAYERKVIVKYFSNVYKKRAYGSWPEDLLQKLCKQAREELCFAVADEGSTEERRKIKCIVNVCNNLELKKYKQYHLETAMSCIAKQINTEYPRALAKHVK